jgi:hypothetical protein
MKTLLIFALLALGSSSAFADGHCNKADHLTLQPTSCTNTDAVFGEALKAAREVVSDKVYGWTVTGNSEYVTNFCDGTEVWPIHFGEPGNFGITVHVTVVNCSKFTVEE